MDPARKLSEAVGEPIGPSALSGTGRRSPTMPPMEFLGRWYARRIVNVNVNVIVAGMLAMALTLIPVHFTRHLDINSKWVIVAITHGCDASFDVANYYLLHWLANHWRAFPWVKHRKPHPAGLSFIRDATLVQFERAMLVPVYYGVALAIQLVMLHSLKDGSDHRELTTVVGLGGGLICTRVIHTAWMLWSERRWAKRASCTPEICCPGCGEPLPFTEAVCPVCALKDAAEGEHRRKDSA